MPRKNKRGQCRPLERLFSRTESQVWATSTLTPWTNLPLTLTLTSRADGIPQQRGGSLALRCWGMHWVLPDSLSCFRFERHLPDEEQVFRF